MVPRVELLEWCWLETFVSESALTRCLARLRKAVQAPPTAPPVIETRHRQGYRFVAEVRVLTPMPSPPTTDTGLLHARPSLQPSAPAVPLVVPDTQAPSAPRESVPLPPPPTRHASP
jgi:eukaryotic-like serine/threonine-protein kinase